MQIYPVQDCAALRVIGEDGLKTIYSNGGKICGGFARHLATLNVDSVWKDVDVFFNKESDLKTTIDLLTDLYGEIVSYKSDYSGIEVNNLRVSDKLKFQLIHQEDTTGFESILEKFDFTVCQAYYDFYNNKVITTDEWKRHEDARLLRWSGKGEIHLYRLFKYVHKGYLPNYDLVVRAITKDGKAESLSFLYDVLCEIYYQKNSFNNSDENIENEFALLKQIKSLSKLLERK